MLRSIVVTRKAASTVLRTKASSLPVPIWVDAFCCLTCLPWIRRPCASAWGDYQAGKQPRLKNP